MGLFQQLSYHARKIFDLLDLYESDVLDKILAYAIVRDKLDIKSIKQLIRKNFFEIIPDSEYTTIVLETTDVEGITRSCDYYEENQEVTSI